MLNWYSEAGLRGSAKQGLSQGGVSRCYEQSAERADKSADAALDAAARLNSCHDLHAGRILGPHYLSFMKHHRTAGSLARHQDC